MVELWTEPAMNLLAVMGLVFCRVCSAANPLMWGAGRASLPAKITTVGDAFGCGSIWVMFKKVYGNHVRVLSKSFRIISYD
ncbi:hypothetical protein BO86DRAFT_119241 [Aspergillus japonicus CBS 114.51]|uniref:Uncharacterized protein n=1 Tax=Aspergillus japonicus CBS 114.51 TaxID=1448312 RepID=A0A8T8WZD0_ASPJA|nr:hypothetical protein BO86DRAFT_119241 [Aspergillus japonicus CBS 114.51]RAH81000.1 hypothetical protein BO86DRAFT_119241 [Aspergillus japonicus CBS 114.51]